MTNNQKEKIFSNKFIQNFLENEPTIIQNEYKFAEIASSLAYYLKSFSKVKISLILKFLEKWNLEKKL